MKYVDAGSSGEFGWHATELALRCPRLYAAKYRGAGGAADPGLHPGPARGDPLRIGSIGHAGLAHHYVRRMELERGGDPEAWAPVRDAMIRCAGEVRAPASEADLAMDAVDAYVVHWMSERVEVVAVEEVIRTEFAGEPYTQRIDLAVREPDGKIRVWDHKFVGRISASLVERYTLSGQFLGLVLLGAKRWGAEFGGVRINAIQLRGRDPARFSRMEIDPAPAALRLLPVSVVHARDRIRLLDASGLAPADWPGTFSEQACMTAYGRCRQFEACRWGAAR